MLIQGESPFILCTCLIICFGLTDDVLNNLAFLLSNCVRGNSIDLQKAKVVVGGILHLLDTYPVHEHMEMTLDCVWGLSYVCHSGAVEVFDYFIEVGIPPRLNNWLSDDYKSDSKLQTVAFKIGASFMSSDKDEHAQIMLDQDFLPLAYKILREGDPKPQV